MLTLLPKICAPSDKAFENIPYTSLNGIWDPNDKVKTTAFLQYHILRSSLSIAGLDTGPTYLESTLLTAANYTNVTNGQNILVNRQPGDVAVLTSSLGTRCTVLERDIAFQGGQIQIIDNLLIPPAPLRQTAEAFQAQSFVAALYAAGLMPEVGERPNVTIFAPRDAAMELVGGSLEKLNGSPAALARIMGYHIVPDQVIASADLANASSLMTLSQGHAGGSGYGNSSSSSSSNSSSSNTLIVRQAGNNKFVNSAQIIQPDILIANGIMHLIADVLNPDEPSIAPNASAPTQPPAFPVSVASHPFSSALPCTSDCPTSTESTRASKTTDAKSTSKSSKNGGMPGPTAHVAAAALGLLGAGILI